MDKTLIGEPDVRLSNGKTEDTGYSKAHCAQECDANTACKSFVYADFYFSVGFCELWDKAPDTETAFSGAQHCTKPYSPGPAREGAGRTAEDLFGAANRLFDAGNRTEALSLYREAVDRHSHPGSQFRLGSVYYDGLGVPQDQATGIEWWGRAALQGYASAQTELGYLHLQGLEGVSCGGHRAPNCSLCTRGNGETWCNGQCEWAAASALPSALEALASSLGLVTGPPTCVPRALARAVAMPKDEHKALGLFRSAAAQGEKRGQQALAGLYSVGIDGDGGFLPHVPTALQWCLKAANQGVAAAQHTVGSIYAMATMQPVGVPRDDASALFWMQLAMESKWYSENKETLEDTVAKETGLDDQDNFVLLLSMARAQCTGLCRAKAEAMAREFKVQDACTASLFSRSNHCNNTGDPTPL